VEEKDKIRKERSVTDGQVRSARRSETNVLDGLQVQTDYRNRGKGEKQLSWIGEDGAGNAHVMREKGGVGEGRSDEVFCYM